MKTKFSLLSACILLANFTHAQSFIPDAEGYVADPAFHKLIKTRGYQLVCAFDTLQRKPLIMVAMVIQNGKQLYIDNQGKLYAPKKPAFEPYVAEINYDASADIVISGGGPSGNNKFKEIEANGKYGIASPSGKVLVSPQYSQIKECRGCNLRGNMLLVEKNRKWGMISNTGTVIVPPTYENIRPITYKGQMMITTGVGQKERYGLIDSLGKVLLPPIYSGMMEYLSDEHLIKIYNETENGPRYGRASVKGKLLIEPIYEQILGVSNGIILVKQNNKTGAVSMSGKVLLEPIYDHAFTVKGLPYLQVSNKGKYGLFTTAGTVIFPIIYDDIIPGKHGFIFKKDNTWGIMDIKGKLIKTLVYDRIEGHGKYLLVCQDEKWGVINTQGKLVFPIKYDRFRNPRNIMRSGLAEVDQSRTDMTIDRYGNEYVR
jgi:hypothetical protein